MIAARPCVLRFVSLTHTHTTLSLKGTGDRKGARAAGQAGNLQHASMTMNNHVLRERRTNTVRCMFKTRWMIFKRHPPSNAHDAHRARPPTKIHLSKIHLYMSMSNCPCVSYHAIEPHHRAQLLRQRVLPDTGRSIFLRSASKTGGAPMRSSASGFSAPS